MKLWQYLTYQRKRRMKKEGRTVHRDSKIPEAKSIDLRPEVVNERTRGGDLDKLKDKKAVTKQLKQGLT